VILLFSCRRWAGQPACLDAEEIGWFAPEDLEQLAMPPLDYPLARALKKVI
jgi:8-oxo-dGTP diphosphatase